MNLLPSENITYKTKLKQEEIFKRLENKKNKKRFAGNI